MVAKHFAHASVADSVSKVAARMVRLNRENDKRGNFNARASTSTVSSTVSDTVAVIGGHDPTDPLGGSNSSSGVSSMYSGSNDRGGRSSVDKPEHNLSRMPSMQEYPGIFPEAESQPYQQPGAPSYPNPRNFGSNFNGSNNNNISANNFTAPPPLPSGFFAVEPPEGWVEPSDNNNEERGGHFNQNFVEFPEEIDRSGRFPVNKW